VGFGRVGRILAPLAAAFGLRLLACDPYVDKQAVAQYGAEKVDSLDALIPQSDFVVILARYTPETRHIIGARELALMKPTACLVNAARGPLLDYEALYPALKEHRIKGALLDVFATEPLNAGNPLLDLDNVLLTPHIAGATQESVLCAGQMMSADLRRIILGERPVNCINPQVLDAPRRWDPQSLRQP
jgi:D-3-phosphoglycerate dehydrogenase